MASFISDLFNPEVWRQLPSAETAGKIVQKIGEVGKNLPGVGNLGTALGGAAALPYVSDVQNQLTKQNLDLNDTILQQIRNPKTTPDQKQRYIKMIQQTSPEIISQIPELNVSPKAVITDAAQLALMAASGLSSVGAGIIKPQTFNALTELQRLTKGVGQSIRASKYGTAGKLLNYLENNALPITKEAIIGSGLFALGAIGQEKSVEEIKKEAMIGGAVSVAIPPVASVAIKGVSKAAGAVGEKVVQPVYQKIIQYLENTAQGVGKTERIGQAINETERTLAVLPPATLGQKVAQTTLQGIEAVKQLPAKITDRFAVGKNIEQKIEQAKGAPLSESEKVYRNMRLTQSAAEGSAQNAIENFVVQQQQFKDIENQVKARLLKLDFLNRARLGQKVASEETAEQLESGLQRLIQEAGENEPRVQEAIKLYSEYNTNLLKERVNAGLISQKQMDNLLKTHPNYVPHNVVLGIDEQIAHDFRLPSTLNVSKTDIQKAVGSTREIEDPFVATLQRTPIAYQLIEKNKTLRGLVEAQEQYGVIRDMRPLVTAKQVEERIVTFKEMANIRTQVNDFRGIVARGIVEDKTLLKKIKILNLKLRQQEQSLMNEATIFQGENGELDALYKTLLENRDKAEATKEFLRFVNPEQESGYEAFKKLAARRKSLLDTGTDEVKLKSLYPGQNIDDTLFKGAGELSNDELLTQFQNRYRIEQGLPLIEKGILRSFGAQQKRVAGAEARVFGTEATITAKAKAEKQLSKSIDEITAQVDALQQKRKELFLQAKALKNQKTKPGEETINFFRDGIKETWVVPNDLAVAIKNLDADRMSTLMRALTLPQRLLKNFATRFNVSFTAPNFLRDRQTAAITADAFIESLARRSGATPTAIDLDKQQLLRLWRESGGAGGSIFREGKPPATLLKDLQSGRLRRYGIGTRPDKLIDDINEFVESSTRLKVFRQGLERGLSPKDAALAARDATVDFAKMGSFMRSINQIIPFLNARVQGFINIPRALVAQPEHFARIEMWTAAYPTMALQQHNRQFESYKNVPQYMKDNYWIIMVGEVDDVDDYGHPEKIPQYFSIKKGEGQMLVANPIQHFLDLGDNADFRTTSEMLMDTLGNVTPVSFDSTYFSMGDGMKKTAQKFTSLFGPVANITAGLAGNIDPFTGNPIIPKGRENAAPELQKRRTTSQTAIDLAKYLDISPAQLEFILGSFGGVPQDLLRTRDLIKGKVNTLEPSAFATATKIPAIQRFVRESGEFGSPQTTAQRKMKEELEKQVTSESLREKDMADAIWRDMLRLPKDQRLPYLNRLRLTDGIKRRLQSLKTYEQSIEVLDTNDPIKIRASYINTRLYEMLIKKIPREDMVDYLNKLKESKILTNDVAKEIKKLQLQPAQ